MSDVCTPNNTEPHKRLLGKLKQLAERLDDGMMHFIPHDVYLAQRLPSSSSVNPALTIMANALRVGDHLTERLGAAMPSAVQAPAQSMQAGLMSHAAAAR